jgi:hypothetical protein
VGQEHDIGQRRVFGAAGKQEAAIVGELFGLV